MNGRFVSPHILSVYALQEEDAIEWLDQRRDTYGNSLENLRGEFGDVARLELFQGQPVLHLRWLLNPAVGLPLEPFVVWQRPRDPALVTPQQYAELDDWEPMDVVGLPVDEGWGPPVDYGKISDQTYGEGQGLVNFGLIPPWAAAVDRLIAGAPFSGWDFRNDKNEQMPRWEPPDLVALVVEHLKPNLVEDLRGMLLNEPNPEKHTDYRPPKRTITQPRQVGYLGDRTLAAQQSTLDASPWKLALINAASDPFASLALGFGTVVPFDPNMVTMVSVFHRRFEREFATVLLDIPDFPELDPPKNVQAVLRARNRPAKLDGDYADTVDVLWERPQQRRLWPDPTRTPLSYAVARFGPQGAGAQMLLARRPANIGGWTPFVASAGGAGQQVRFPEGRLEAGFRSTPKSCSYSVAAQDLFGRWSRWRSAAYNLEAEPFPEPRLVSVQLSDAGRLAVDFAWDWSDRSPEFIEISGRFSEPASPELVNQRIEFGGDAAGQFDLNRGRVEPLEPDRKRVVGWGTEQDANPGEPGMRYYRLTVEGVEIEFGGRDVLVFDVAARGQGHLHQKWIPNFGVTPWSQPLQTRLFNRRHPDPPKLKVPEPPQWASLPDMAGISRALLRWPRQAGLRYAVYTASETALLAAADQAGSDLSASYTDRVEKLRTLLGKPDLRPDLRKVFRRLTDIPIEDGEYEAALPRGSRVIHAFVVTAIKANQVESDWPTKPMQFLLVAAPRLAIPGQPALEVGIDPGVDGPTARFSVRLRDGADVERVELFRASNETAAQDVDSMGPPFKTLEPNGGLVLDYSEPLIPSWRKLYFRAVAWSGTNPETGEIAARSQPSPAVSLVFPPQTPPALSELKVYRTSADGTDALVGWASDAPRYLTPLGFHRFVLMAQDQAGAVRGKIERQIDSVVVLDDLVQIPAPDAGGGKIFSVSDTYYAWVARPVQDQPFTVIVKAIDPLGRIGAAQIEVPVTQVLLPPQLGEIGLIRVDEGKYNEGGGLVVIGWEVKSPLEMALLGAYSVTFTVSYPDPMVDHPCSITLPLSQVASVAEEINLEPLCAAAVQESGVYRIDSESQGPYQFRAWCCSAGRDYEVEVTLTDPDGQSASASYKLPELPF
ncbi:MAG: hypothetical protein Kow0063_28900 [Anaerolineae bacterium]